MKLLVLLSIIFLSNISIAQENSDNKFPNSYFGKYKGDLIISTDNGQQQIPMEFHLLATDSIGKFVYTIIYGTDKKQQIRAYTLYEKDKKTGNYLLDEHNGILLNAKVVENRIYFLFEVMGSLLTTFITFDKEHLVFEVVATQTKDKVRSGGLSEDIPEVISYPASIVQRGVLMKYH